MKIRPALDEVKTIAAAGGYKVQAVVSALRQAQEEGL